MNFLINSCSFEKTFLFNQNNSTFPPQNRIPFTDITQQMNNFVNYNKNQQINIFTKNFNDFTNQKEFTFLKKKSYEITRNNSEIDEENKQQKYVINKPKKYSHNSNKICNSLINNLEEENEEENKENKCVNGNIFGNNMKRKDDLLSLSQILSESINEKKEFDKNERDNKKANKLKQLKMFIKNRKNILEYSKNNDIVNKENIINTQYSNDFQEPKRVKELNMMCLD